MKILVINSGSSSLKYQLIDMDGEKVLAKGLCERIGIDGRLKHEDVNSEEVVIDAAMENHAVAFQMVIDKLTNPEKGVIKSTSEIGAVGHRYVNGGEKFSEIVLSNDDIVAQLEDSIEFAPLHNPAHITGIKACKEVMGDVPQCIVFDTAFHRTMPKYAYLYPLPYELYEKYAVRRYGFHGTSHKFVSQKAAEFLGKKPEDLKMITCHLGNGSSLCAVDGGKCVDTSMGFTPLAGFMMGTRCGDVDPSVVTYIMKKENLSPDEMADLMNKKSGALGVSGISSDFRDLDAAVEKGDEKAKLALDIFVYGVKKFIGSYAAAMGGLDCMVFTAGIGENNAMLRDRICEGLEFLGVSIDDEKNAKRGGNREISSDNSKVKVLVIPTNEELMIARETKELVENLK
ncbi:MAG: acetate kinase [Clostridia bacterium]|nr:acetate kinase [Clostridia bacterium]